MFFIKAQNFKIPPHCLGNSSGKVTEVRQCLKVTDDAGITETEGFVLCSSSTVCVCKIEH